MKISEILDHSDQIHTHVEESKEHSNHLGTHIEDKHSNIVTTCDTYVKEHWEQEDVVQN